MISIRPITAAETRPLRQRVLRPTQRADALVYPGDDDPLTLHVGAFEGDTLVGVASVYPQGEDGAVSTTDWRLRGMAVAPVRQGAGVGRRLLEATVEYARERGGRRYWCNARATAVAFYERGALRTVGAPFEIPVIGLHYVMERAL